MSEDATGGVEDDAGLTSVAGVGAAGGAGVDATGGVGVAGTAGSFMVVVLTTLSGVVETPLFAIGVGKTGVG